MPNLRLSIPQDVLHPERATCAKVPQGADQGIGLDLGRRDEGREGTSRMKDWIIRNIRNGWLLEASGTILLLTGAYVNRFGQQRTRRGRDRLFPE